MPHLLFDEQLSEKLCVMRTTEQIATLLRRHQDDSERFDPQEEVRVLDLG